MRLVLRVAGTWLIGLALVLLVVDGTKSLAANGLLLTSLSDAWLGIHAASLAAVEGFFSEGTFPEFLDSALETLLDWPAFAVFGVPGIVLVMAGRVPRRERFLRQDQI